MPASASNPVRHTQPHHDNPQVENPQTNGQDISVDKSLNQPASVDKEMDLVHSLQYAPFTSQRAVQSGARNTDRGNLKGMVDCESCTARGVCAISLNPIPGYS
jgi:hypothetical protein